MPSIARVQARGQVTVPQEIRETCNVEPGSELLFVKTGENRFECQVLARTSLVELTRRFALPGSAPDLKQLREEMGDDMVRPYLKQIGHLAEIEEQ